MEISYEPVPLITQAVTEEAPVKDPHRLERRGSATRVLHAPAERAEVGPLTSSTGVVLKLRNAKDPIITDFDTHREIVNTEGGFSWGEKISAEGKWHERWLTQQKEQTSFGRTQGEDKAEARTWEHEWHVDSNEVVINRQVIQYNKDTYDTSAPRTDAQVAEKWYERIVIDQSAGTATESKYGVDYKGDTERRWQSKTTYKFDPAETSPNSVKENTSKRADPFNDSTQAWVSRLTEDCVVHFEFEESQGSVCRSLSRTREDGKEVHEQRFKDKVSGEEWVDNWTLWKDGKSGRKRGLNTQNEEWFEEWQEEGSHRTLKKWKISADKTRTWGFTEKTNTNDDGVEVTSNEKWSKNTHKNDDGTLVVEEVADKWFSQAEGTDRWGDKAKLIIHYRGDVEIDDLEAATACGQISSKVESKEKWYNNSVESKTDRWTEETTYDDSGSILTRIKHGDVDGCKHDKSMTWGERWRKQWREGTECIQSETDKWWRESHGNSWGEKEYEDDTGVKVEEKWYDNGIEKQTTRWHCDADGKQWGTKSGSRWDAAEQETVYWREDWNRKDDEDHWVDRSWTKKKVDGQETAWGELEGVKGKQTWREKWNKGDGKEYSERKDDDGCGNFAIHKRGVLWNESGEVVDWFADRYGESLGKGEKWAFKEGADCNQNKWMEKWNENRYEKSAVKEGSNLGGDKWKEEWIEKFDDTGNKTRTWAAKSGQNIEGQQWFEEWIESENKKQAKKTSKNIYSKEEWDEAWGEEVTPDGTSIKWTSKWADDGKGSRWGQSWGDEDSKYGSHRWGEEWNSSGYLNKWDHRF